MTTDFIIFNVILEKSHINGLKKISIWVHENYSGGIIVKGTNTNMSLKPSECYDIENVCGQKYKEGHKE